MKLLSCHVENFGALRDFRLRFEEDLTPVLAENGWGKTTLAAFLTAMFYGLPPKGSRAPGSVRGLYAPWNGETFGGTVLFEAGGTTYRMIRTFGASPKGDSFLLYDERTGYASEDYSPRIGEELFGIDREAFLRTASFSCGDRLEAPTASVQARIGTVSAQAEDLAFYDSAFSELSSESRRLSPERSSGALFRAAQELDSLRTQTEKIDSLRQDVRTLSERLRKEQARHRSLQREQDALLSSLPAPGQEVLGTLPPEEPAGNEYEESLLRTERSLKILRRKRKALRQKYTSLEASPEAAKKQAVLCAAAGFLLLTAAAAGALLIGSAFFVFTLLLLAGAAAAGTYAVLRLRRGNKDALLLDALAEEDGRLARKQHRLRKRHAELLSSKPVSAAEPSPAPPPAPAQMLRIRELTLELDSSRKETARLSRDLEEARSALTACEEAEARRNRLLEEYEDLQEEYYVCTQTMKFLRQARDTLNVRFMDPFRSSLLRYYGAVADIAEEAVRTDASLGVSLVMDGLPRDPGVLSDGARDLLGFCRRMAILDAMYPEDKPFLILDDPFSGLDEKHLARALALVREVSCSWQVLYFTCQGARLP